MEDDDIQKLNAIKKLDTKSTHIMESATERTSSVHFPPKEPQKYWDPSNKIHPGSTPEVVLATMDAKDNEAEGEDELLPKLRKKWVESAADILTGAPPHLPPF